MKLTLISEMDRHYREIVRKFQSGEMSPDDLGPEDYHKLVQAVHRMGGFKLPDVEEFGASQVGRQVRNLRNSRRIDWGAILNMLAAYQNEFGDDMEWDDYSELAGIDDLLENQMRSSVQRRMLSEKKYETQVSEIDGEKIKEKKGKLSGDLGKPAFQASEKELDDYIEAGEGAEKQKRVARVNLMKAHKKGHQAQKKD